MKPKSNKSDSTGTIDRCQTPTYALDPILPHLKSGWHIWEPAAGEGNIVRVLSEQGYQVSATDILTGEDFFTCDLDYDCIVTNPPFSIKYEWLKRCYHLQRPFALLMPVETLGAAKAQRLFEEFGVEIIFVRPRINFKMPYASLKSSSQFPTAWFTWKLGVGKSVSYFVLKVRNDAQVVMELA